MYHVACLASASSVVLGGKTFMERFDNKDRKGGSRLYSFITNSSRLYSFIDDMLEDNSVQMDASSMESVLLHQPLLHQPLLPDEVLVRVQDMCGGWSPEHDIDTYTATAEYSSGQMSRSDDSGHAKSLGDHALFSIGPLTITDVHRGEVKLTYVPTICSSVEMNLLSSILSH